MRFRRITVDRFGVWKALELGPLDDGLNAFYGANETGKSTLLEFIRGLLFGFGASKRRRFAPIDTDASWGGSAQLATVGGMTLLRRSVVDGVERDLELRNAEGQPIPADYLSRVLGSVDEVVFERIFAIGLRELQELATLDQTEAAAALYRLTTGVDRVSLAEVAQELAASRERLLPSDDRLGIISDLLAQRERLHVELRALGQLTDQYAQGLAEQAQLDRELAGADAELATRAAQRHLVETALRLSSAWQERHSMQQELNAIGPQSAIPDELLRGLDVARRRAEICRRNLRKLRARRGRLLIAARKLPARSVLARELAEIEALCDQLPWVAQVEEQVAVLERALATDEAQLGDASGQTPKSLSIAGPIAGQFARRQIAPLAVAGSIGPSAALVRIAEVDVAAVKRLRQAARQRRAARVSWSEARKSLDALGPESLPDARTKSSSGGLGNAVPTHEELTPALEQAGQLVAKLRRRVQIDERMHQLSDRRHVLDEQHRHFLDRQVLPTWVLSSLGVFFAFGIALFVGGVILPEAVTAPFSETLIGLGVIGSIAAVGLKVWIERRNKRGLEICRQQLATLRLQQHEAEQQRDELDRELPTGGGPLHARLQAAQKQLADLEGQVPAAAKRQSNLAARERADEAVQRARDELRAAHKRWNAELRACDLPTAISPSHAWRLLRERKRHGTLASELAARRDEIGQRRRAIDSLATRVATAASRAHAPLVAGTLSEQLEQLREFAGGERRKADERFEITERIRQVTRRARPWRRRLRQCRIRRRRLLDRADASSEKVLRERHAMGLRARSLAEKLANLDAQFAAAVAPPQQEPLQQLLAQSDASMLAAQQADLTQHVAELEQSRRARAERRGAVAAEVARLAGEQRTGQARFELGIVEAKLRDSLKRWQTLAVLQQLVETVGRAYERDHQPATLREASLYLDRLTQGRYVRVWTPWGEHQLLLEERSGATTSIEQLSDGAREQLFLALRLALVAEFARRGVSLPVVLDDVLVNFDAQRAQAAAALLRDFAAAGHQVLVFTCHEHLAELFHAQGTPVRDLGQRGQLLTRPQVVPEATVPDNPVAELRVDPAESPPPRRRSRRAKSFAPSEDGQPVIEVVDDRPAREAVSFVMLAGDGAEEFAGEFAERHAKAAAAATDSATSERSRPAEPNPAVPSSADQ
ncbi:MAG: AAA family ATPase [Pirellulales bacterium]|nr:AAA family ATPase [Pirellulales bacterium]